MDTLLITGGAGFIGSNLVPHALSHTDHHVVVFDKLTYAANPLAVEEFTNHARVDLISGDIADPQVQCKVTELYDPSDEAGVAYNDPSINIIWPITSPLLSERDRCNPSLGDVAERIGLVLPSSFRAVVTASPERVRG